MSDVLANFSCLDELTQVIYQGICKFVVLSTVSDDKWNVHVGLSGEQGRWWHGSWTEDDIHHRFGSKVSDQVLESCAERLAEFFVQGDICISDWNTEKGAAIKLTIGPTSKKPMHVSLFEMSAEEAAAHATQVFVDIALQAQSRKCRLYPSSVDFSTEAPNTNTTIPHKRKEPSSAIGMGTKEHGFSEETGGSHRRSVEHAEKPVPSKPDLKLKAGRSAEVATKTQVQTKSSTPPQAQKPTATLARRAKGASLANPNKKARKYQAVEFESDDE